MHFIKSIHRYSTIGDNDDEPNHRFTSRNNTNDVIRYVTKSSNDVIIYAVKHTANQASYKFVGVHA